jgi:hypothetical protein
LQKRNGIVAIRSSAIIETGIVPSQVGNPLRAAASAVREETENDIACLVVFDPFGCGQMVSGGRAYANAAGPNYEQGDGVIITRFYTFHFKPKIESGAVTVDSYNAIKNVIYPYKLDGVYRR